MQQVYRALQASRHHSRHHPTSRRLTLGSVSLMSLRCCSPRMPAPLWRNHSACSQRRQSRTGRCVRAEAAQASGRGIAAAIRGLSLRTTGRRRRHTGPRTCRGWNGTTRTWRRCFDCRGSPRRHRRPQTASSAPRPFAAAPLRSPPASAPWSCPWRARRGVLRGWRGGWRRRRCALWLALALALWLALAVALAGAASRRAAGGGGRAAQRRAGGCARGAAAWRTS